MLAFVAGATGYVGREVVRLLAARGTRVLAHVRSDSPRLAEWRQRFAAVGAEVDATPWQASAMEARLADLQPSQVFALLGTTRRRTKASGGVDDYQKVDVGLSLILLGAAVRASSQPRFVYLSAAGVRDDQTTGYYGARARVERAVRASGLPYTIARPSFITGRDRDEDRPIERFFAATCDGLLAAVSFFGGGKLRARYRSTTNVALAAALVEHAADPTMANRVVESESLR